MPFAPQKYSKYCSLYYENSIYYLKKVLFFLPQICQKVTSKFHKWLDDRRIRIQIKAGFLLPFFRVYFVLSIEIFDMVLWFFMVMSDGIDGYQSQNCPEY